MIMVGIFGKKDILYKSEDVMDEFQERSQLEINQEIERRLKALEGGGTAQATFTIVPSPSDAKVVINGEERASITVAAGTEVSYEVSAEGYATQSGSQIVEEDTELPVTLVEAPADKVTFTIVADPSDAEVTINGEKASSISVEKGSTVSWEVVKEGYISQSGSQTVEEDIELPVILEPVSQSTLTISTPEPSAYFWCQCAGKESNEGETSLTVGVEAGEKYPLKVIMHVGDGDELLWQGSVTVNEAAVLDAAAVEAAISVTVSDEGDNLALDCRNCSVEEEENDGVTY